ncbi:nuclear transport factor 2 family protein [Kitasatospora sp. NPDC097691]|uniref:nuclear transport factor 2 family protein n=1 Tax=Kitasatospora sp. NPDC097691 TaxID=3157231 RepID=UPI003331AE64
MIAELQQAVSNYAHALDEPNVPEPEAVLTEDTTWTFTNPGQGELGPVTGRAAVLDPVRDGYTGRTRDPDAWAQRSDGADYGDAPPMASAVRASPRSQAWARSLS